MGYTWESSYAERHVLEIFDFVLTSSEIFEARATNFISIVSLPFCKTRSLYL